MRYEQPNMVLLGNAAELVQMDGELTKGGDDLDGINQPTASAYRADE